MYIVDGNLRGVIKIRADIVQPTGPDALDNADIVHTSGAEIAHQVLYRYRDAKDSLNPHGRCVIPCLGSIEFYHDTFSITETVNAHQLPWCRLRRVAYVDTDGNEPD